MLRVHSQRLSKLLFDLIRLIFNTLRHLFDLKCHVVKGRIEGVDHAIALLRMRLCIHLKLQLVQRFF